MSLSKPARYLLVAQNLILALLLNYTIYHETPRLIGIGLAVMIITNSACLYFLMRQVENKRD